MKTKKLFFLAAALFMSANVMTAKAECLQNLLEGVTMTLQRSEPAAVVATWNDGVIEASGLTGAGVWTTQLEFGFPTIAVDHTKTYRITMTVEVLTGRLDLGIRFYSGAETNEINWPNQGDAAARERMTVGTHEINFVRDNLPAGFSFDRFSIFAGSQANTSFRITNIMFCEIEPIIPPVFVCDGPNVLEGLEFDLVYTYVIGAPTGEWNNGVFSGEFTAAQGLWAGQYRFNFPAQQLDVTNRNVRVSMRVEVGGTGTLPFEVRFYRAFGGPPAHGNTGNIVTLGAGRAGMGSPLTQGVHYLEWDVVIPPAVNMAQISRLQIIMGNAPAGVSFAISEISFCQTIECEGSELPEGCIENLLEGVQMTAAPTFYAPAAAADWAAWNNGVITATTQAATSGLWGLQWRFEFPNIYVDYTEEHGLFLTIEVEGGDFDGAFRLYRGAGGAAAEFNYPGPAATARRLFTPGVHQVELVRDDFAAAFTYLNRFFIVGRDVSEGVSIRISNISFCRMGDDGGVYIPPVERNEMSIHQAGNLIVINSDVEITSAVMFTISGQQVAVRLRGNQIDTSALASGVYLLQVNGTNVFRVIVR